MNPRTRLKLIKLRNRPGEFARDFFLKRYPVADAPQEGPRAKKKPVAPNPFDLAANHHMRDPFESQLTIDAVVTWVDGDDPAWQERKARTLGNTRTDSVADNAARFQSKDELRYCFRSLDTYAPWVRTIYLVTDRQRPAWLTDHPRVRVVDHTEIIPAEYLPTFNSHVIETWLHRIPGLSEHFIYLNDDVMLTRPTPRNYYFASNGIANNFITRAETPDGPPTYYDTPTQRGAKNVRRLLKREFDVHLRYNHAHTVFPLRRSTFEAAHELFGSEIAEYGGNRVRGPSDIPFATFLAPNLAFLRAEAVAQRTTCFYFDIRSAMAPRFYKTLLNRRGTDAAPWSMCLNDVVVEDSPPDAEERVVEFMESYFPVPAPWEGFLPGQSAAPTATAAE